MLERTTSDGPTSVSTSSGFVNRLFADVRRTLADVGAAAAVAAAAAEAMDDAAVAAVTVVESAAAAAAATASALN